MCPGTHESKGPNSKPATGWFSMDRWPKDPAHEGGLSLTAQFWIIVGLAFVVRLLVLLQLSENHPGFGSPIVDSRWHYLWAQKIAAGDWLGDGAFFRAPLYPYLLGIWIKIFGDGLWPIRIMQAFVGGLTAGLTLLIGRESFGRRVGLIAGVIAALYGTFIYYETELLIEVIAVPLGLLAVYLSMRESSRPSPRLWRWLVIGIVLGFVAIARPNILLVIPAFLWWAWPNETSSRGSTILDRITGPLALIIGLLLPIVPVTVRNYIVAQDFVLISYQGGVNLWLGNNPQADGLTMIMPEITLDESVEWNRFVSKTDSLAASLAGHDLKPSEVSSFWTSRALTWIFENPRQAMVGWLKKTWYFLGGYEVSDQTDIYAFASHSWLLSLLISHPLIYIPFGLIIPFGLLGMLLVWRRSPQTRPLLGFVFLYALTIIPFLATARHRLPIVPIFVISAAAAAVQFARLYTSRNFKSLVVPALLLIALMVALNQRTVERMLSNPAFLHYQMALTHEQVGDYEGAAIEYEKALEIEPMHLASRKNLAYALYRMGSYDSAVAVSFSYLRHRQTDAEAYNNIGLAYLGQGDTAKAEASFRVALRSNAKLPQPYLNLGNIAMTRGENGSAADNFRKAIAADSTFAGAYSGLAIILAGAKMLEMAETLLTTGLRHVPDHAILQANLGSLYLTMDRPKDAIVPLERALHWQPHATAIRINLAIAYMSTQRLEEARDQLRQVLAVDPTNASAKRILDEIESMGENL